MALTVEKVRDAIEEYYRLPRHEVIRLMNETRARWVIGKLGLADNEQTRRLVAQAADGLAASRTPVRMAVDK